tara:strand:- start:2039 stop:2452 length:414 start_codon:yes stop_codon:yes gene_type:complete
MNSDRTIKTQSKTQTKFSRDYFMSSQTLLRAAHLTTRMENKMEDKKQVNLDEDFTGYEVNALLNTPIKMEYSMEDWDKMHGLGNDEKFIRAIFETVIGDNLANWTREELLRHLNDLLNEREEALDWKSDLIDLIGGL